MSSEVGWISLSLKELQQFNFNYDALSPFPLAHEQPNKTTTLPLSLLLAPRHESAPTASGC